MSTVITMYLSHFYLIHGGQKVVGGPWKVKGAATAERNRISRWKARRERQGVDTSSYHPHVAEYTVAEAKYTLTEIVER
jgi:hypothetical protein